MKDLVLHVKKKYFEQIKAGEKTEEYREANHYWQKRIIAQQYKSVVICCGYPKAGDNDRRISFPWRGWTSRVITHPHFGDLPVTVFVIRLQKKDA